MSDVIVMPNTVEAGEQLLEQAERVVVENEQDYERASLFIKAIKELLTEIKDFFEPKKKRAKQVHTDWCNAEKEACKGLEQAEAILKKKMSTWYAAEQARKEEERKKLEAVAKQQYLDPELIQMGPAEKPKGAGQRENWSFTVDDFSILPDEYKVPNDKMLMAEATGKKEKANVPGVRFYKYYTTVNR